MADKNMVYNLALALEISPDEILGYKQYPHKGYTVIMRDFRKFTGVQPASDEELEAELAQIDADAYPADMPDELKPIYDTPRRYKLQELRNLAYFLEIRDASALRKMPLLDEIDAYKTRAETQNYD